VKPSLDDDDEDEDNGGLMTKDLLAEHDEGVKEAPKTRNIPLGIAMASVSGILYGFQFVPLSIWNNKIKDQGHIFDQPKPSDTIQALRFLFSQFAGIFLTSLIGFTVYCIRKGNKPLLGKRRQQRHQQRHHHQHLHHHHQYQNQFHQ
jgi:hypothetical protein